MRWRLSVLMLCLAGSAPAAAQETSSWYTRVEGGQAVAVPWVGARVGRALDEGLALDVGAGGSPEGRGFLSGTGGLEARALTRHRVSVFTRAEAGLLADATGRACFTLSMGGGLAVRLDRSWSLRAGLMRSLRIADAVRGPDYAFVGLERRW